MDFLISLVFSSIGLGYFVYGKKSSEFYFIIFGFVLMSYTYIIHGVVFSIFMGIVFMVCPFIIGRTY